MAGDHPSLGYSDIYKTNPLGYTAYMYPVLSMLICSINMPLLGRQVTTPSLVI